MSDDPNYINQKPRNVKKSDFVAQTTIGDTAYFDFILEGQNYKVSKADFMTIFGLIGTIVQKGEITGVPVLTIDGTINNIRNILGRYGVLASVSPEGGIMLDHNFVADSVGEPVLVDTTETQPTIRSIKAGTGITLTVIGDAIEVSLT